jgi:SAM-dependent methyltransferase
MDIASRRAYWENVYTTKSENEVSWFQESADLSLELMDLLAVTPHSAVIDIGGGASRLVDGLVARGFDRVTVLDLSDRALSAAKARMGEPAAGVEWVVADIATWETSQAYDVWHDRAAFHFLTDATDRKAYVERLRRSLRPGGHAIIGTFALDGPERCSGLPVMRYDAESLRETLGGGFELVVNRRHEHATPWGAVQRFQFSVFRFG